MTRGISAHSSGGPLQESEIDKGSLPQTTVEVIPQHTRGHSGRIWSMPYETRRDVPMSPESPLLQIYPDTQVTIENTLLFLATHANNELTSWLRAVAPSMNEFLRNKIDAVLEYQSLNIPESGVTVAPSSPAPRAIAVPTIDPSHWAYQAHFELGHFKSVSDDLIADCHREARSDISAILYYLNRYNDLAIDYCGDKLAQATATPSLNAPYQTCMALCVFTLKLPSHFLALIHHGIALQLLDLRRSVDHSLLPSAQEASHRGRALFDLLTRLYVEDFGA